VSVGICGTTLSKEKIGELAKHSIYLRPDDKDTDFELFALIDDAGDGGQSTEFLDVLKQAISNGKDASITDRHKREELAAWIGVSNSDDLLTWANWLKIAIERYPYRLFLATSDEIKWEMSMKNGLGFLRKRICLINYNDFCEYLRGTKPLEIPGVQKGADHYERFKIWLYHKWIVHLARNVRCLRDSPSMLTLWFYDLNAQDRFHVPHTLPPCFGSPATNTRSEACTVLSLGKIDIGFAPKITQPSEITALAFFSRHGDLYKKSSSGKSWSDERRLRKKHLAISSENLSGGMPSFTRLIDALESSHELRSAWYFLAAAERSLLRIGIADERFQEWICLTEDRAASLFQSRIVAVFWRNEKLYGQQVYRKHRIHLRLPVIRGFVREPTMDNKDWGRGDDGDLDMLWPNDDRGLDALVIHQGILDKWLKQEVGSKSQQSCTRSMLSLRDFVPFVVVTSGRGVPENVPVGTKFMPFGGLEACVYGDHFDKSGIASQMMSLSR
jgi:hypothetical protein